MTNNEGTGKDWALERLGGLIGGGGERGVEISGGGAAVGIWGGEGAVGVCGGDLAGGGEEEGGEAELVGAEGAGVGGGEAGEDLGAGVAEVVA